VPVNSIQINVNGVITGSQVQLIVELPSFCRLFRVESQSQQNNDAADDLGVGELERVLLLLGDQSVCLLALVLEIKPTLGVLADLNHVFVHGCIQEFLDLGNLARSLSDAILVKEFFKVQIVEELVAILRPIGPVVFKHGGDSEGL
jgi:hypothetical protein